MLLQAAKLFLIPSGVLVAALGVAGTEPLKVAISLIGLLIAALWSWSTFRERRSSEFDRSLRCLPWIFGSLWLISVAVHGVLWVTSFARCEALYLVGTPPMPSGSTCQANGPCSDAGTIAFVRGAGPSESSMQIPFGSRSLSLLPNRAAGRVVECVGEKRGSGSFGNERMTMGLQPPIARVRFDFRSIPPHTFFVLHPVGHLPRSPPPRGPLDRALALRPATRFSLLDGASPSPLSMTPGEMAPIPEEKSRTLPWSRRRPTPR